MSGWRLQSRFRQCRRSYVGLNMISILQAAYLVKKKRLRNSYFDEYLRVQCVPLIRGGHDEDPDHPHLHRGWRSRTRES
jgi:hypothetical protein